MGVRRSIFQMRVDESIAVTASLYRGEGTLIYRRRNASECTSYGRNELAMIFERGEHVLIVESDDGPPPILILAEPIQ